MEWRAESSLMKMQIFPCGMFGCLDVWNEMRLIFLLMYFFSWVFLSAEVHAWSSFLVYLL